MDPTFVSAATGGAHVTVQAEPERITIGGIVQLIADPDAPVTGMFDVEWHVVGPYLVSTDDVPISLLGTTTVAGNRVLLGENSRVRATLDTSALSVGSWRVGIRLTRVGEGDEFEDTEASDRAAQFPPNVFSGESDPIEV